MNISKFLTPEEIDSLINVTLDDENSWEIVLNTSDGYLYSLMKELYLDNYNIKIDHTFFGSDTLIKCAKNIPDLLVIDEEITDIPCTAVIKCLKRNEDLKEIKILCCAKSEHAELVYDWGADDFFIKDNLNKLYLLKKVISLLHITENNRPRRRSSYRERKWPRIPLNIIGEIEIYNGKEYVQLCKGEALVADVSRGGAYLTRIKLRNGLTIDESFKIRIKIDKPPLSGWIVNSQIVKLEVQDAARVRFLDISKQDQLKIFNLFEN